MLKKHRVMELAVAITVLLSVTMPTWAGEVLTACEKSDYEKYCTHQEMMDYLAKINAASQEMVLSTYGKSVNGRELVYAVFSRPMVTNPFEAMTSGKPIVILDAGVHGDEHTMRESNLILIRELAQKGTDMNALLDDLVVIMAPCLNPDGTELDKRRNANDYDINRDYIKLDLPETQGYVSNILQKWHPHIQIGGHNGGPYPYNISYLGSTNAAADPALAKFCDEEIFPFIDKNIEAADYTSFYYGSGNKERWKAKSYTPKIFRNYGGISNYISIVFESPSKQDKEGGIKSGLVAYKSILEYCANNPEKVMGLVEQVRQSTIELGQKAEGEIAVQMEYAPEDFKVSYVISEEVEIPGAAGEEPKTERIITQVTNADLIKRPVATKTRPRPYAYILPSGAQKAINLLRRHNITVEVLQQDTSLAIEAYVLKEVKHKEEFNHPEATFVTVEDDTVKKVMDFPKGTYVVRTGQVMGRIISHMLEPETPENIIIWNTIDDLLPQPGPNSLIPIYKLPNPTDLPIVVWQRRNDAQFLSQTVSTSMNQGGTQQVSITPIAVGSPANIVTLYKDNNFGGWEAAFGVGEFTTADLLAAGGVDNDVDSVRVSSGYRVELYAEDNFGGAPEVHTSDSQDTPWHNQVSSLKVMEVIVSLYGNSDFDGWEAAFGIGEFTTADLLAAGGVDNDVDSVRVPSGIQIELYAEDNFGGAPEVHTSDSQDTPWHNQVSSLKVMEVPSLLGGEWDRWSRGLDERWVFEDLQKGMQMARETGKPVFLTYRCVP